MAPLNRLCLSITAALAISSFASVASPSRVSAETASVQDALEEEVLDQESLEQVTVAFGMLTWVPRLESACDLYKEGFFTESILPEAYRILYETYEAGENYKKGMKNSKNLVNDLNVLNNQKTKYIDSYSDLFSLLDQYVKNKRESIVISAGAGEISNQIRFFYDSKK